MNQRNVYPMNPNPKHPHLHRSIPMNSRRPQEGDLPNPRRSHEGSLPNPRRSTHLMDRGEKYLGADDVDDAVVVVVDCAVVVDVAAVIVDLVDVVAV